MDTRNPHSDPPLQQRLGLPAGATLVMGGIIGTSVFLVPGAVADETGHPLLALGVWLLAGVLAGCAAASLAELGSAIPETGGTYVHLRRAYRSEFVAFCFGWMMLFGYASAAVAVVAIMASSYLLPLINPDSLNAFDRSVCAVAIIATIAMVNIAGVRQGGGVQVALTILKVALILTLISVPALDSKFDFAILIASPVEGTPASITASVAEGLILCMFAYSGSHFVTQVAGEMKAPGRTIPVAIFVGFSAVLALYIALNTAYLVGLPFEHLRGSDSVASDLMRASYGERGAAIASIVIFVSALGVLNAQLLSYPRIVFAMARDRLLPAFIATVHPRAKTPWVAVLAVAGCATIYVMSGSYREILGAVAFISHLFMTLAVAGLIILRYREPALERPYRVSLAAPAIFVLVSVPYLALLIVTKPLATAVGLLVVAIGIPIYMYRKDGGAGPCLAQAAGDTKPSMEEHE